MANITRHGEAGLDLGSLETGKVGPSTCLRAWRTLALGRAALSLRIFQGGSFLVGQNLCGSWLPRFLCGFEQVTSLCVPQFPHL